MIQRLITSRVLLATIRDKGICPCPRCIIPKTEFHRLGFVSDALRRISKIRCYFRERVVAARNAIYNSGAPIKGAFPELQLKDLSLVPTFVGFSLVISTIVDHALCFKNSFADALGAFGFDIYRALTVDLLHEFELGIFKSVFKHLLRLLHAINPMSGTSSVATLDARYVLCTVYHTEPSSSCFFGPGFVKFHPLEKMQSVDFLLVSQEPVNVRPNILKMSFRYGPFVTIMHRLN